MEELARKLGFPSFQGPILGLNLALPMQDPVAGLVQLLRFPSESALVGNIAEK
jgi:hypothetical protein